MSTTSHPECHELSRAMNWTQGLPITTSVVKILKNVSQGVLEIYLRILLSGKLQEEGWKEKYPGLQGDLIELECQGEYQVLDIILVLVQNITRMPGFKTSKHYNGDSNSCEMIDTKYFCRQGGVVGWCGTCLLSKGPGEPGKQWNPSWLTVELG